MATDTRSLLRFGLRHPLGGLRLIARRRRIPRLVSHALGAEPHSLSSFAVEFRRSLAYSCIMASVAYSLRSVDPLGATTLYIVCRFLRPQHVVETGVASGVSSAAILQALADNGRGDLHSISLPESAQSDVDREALGGQELGWLIPDSLRGRWALHRGYSRDVLPELLSELDVVNVFFHDSDHAFENVLFELSTVLPRLSVPGLIAVDDANFSYVCEAFLSICKKSGSRPIFVPRLVPPPQTIGISLVS